VDPRLLEAPVRVSACKTPEVAVALLVPEAPALQDAEQQVFAHGFCDVPDGWDVDHVPVRSRFDLPVRDLGRDEREILDQDPLEPLVQALDAPFHKPLGITKKGTFAYSFPSQFTSQRDTKNTVISLPKVNWTDDHTR
jgi:hypothetical protein